MLTLIIRPIFFIFSLFGFFKIISFYSKKKTNYKKEKISSLISIIIPCRNEEKRVVYLLESLKRQTYKNFEIIVVDDNSNDNTKIIARNYTEKVVEVKDYYKDWEGKNAACYVGALNAKGEYLMFIDADVYLKDTSLEYLVNNFPEDGILTVQPYHNMSRFYEQFSLFFNIVVFLGLVIDSIGTFKIKRGFFGPLMIVKKEVYFKIGGHLRVRDSIIEDMDLGNEFVKNNVSIYTISHKEIIIFRMYPEGFKTLFNGWTKNMSLGASRTSILSILIITGIISTSFNLPINIVLTLLGSKYFLFFTLCILYILFVFLLYKSSIFLGNFSFISSFFSPFFSLFFILVFLRSIVFKTLHFSLNWRGRRIKI